MTLHGKDIRKDKRYYKRNCEDRLKPKNSKFYKYKKQEEAAEEHLKEYYDSE